MMTEKRVLDESPQIFSLHRKVISPSHGLGEVISVAYQNIDNTPVEMIIMAFVKNKMTVRIPVQKAIHMGIRLPICPEISRKVLESLSHPIPAIQEKTWQKKRMIYESKLNSGDVFALSEVLRLLYASHEHHSYNEKFLFESCVERLAEEISHSLKKDYDYMRGHITERLSNHGSLPHGLS